MFLTGYLIIILLSASISEQFFEFLTPLENRTLLNSEFSKVGFSNGVTRTHQHWAEERWGVSALNPIRINLRLNRDEDMGG